MNIQLKPKLWTILQQGYTRQTFFKDLSAGLIVGIVALPLAIAFAIASGVKPEQGLATAIVAGLIISALGGSRVQISGPTGAFIVVIYGIVQQYGYEGLAVATLIAGVLLIGAGLARMGALLKFIPYPLTVGFTSGIALIIFSAQLKDLLGLRVASVPAGFIEKWEVYAQHVSDINQYALLIALMSLAILIVIPRYLRRVPASLVAIVLMTALVQLLHLPVETIGSRFGAVASSLPIPTLPHISLDLVRKMFNPALTIALLGAIESLLSAVVADGMMGTKHRPNVELIAQGVGNVISPLFGGIPATGAIARTATNIRSGAQTPIAGIIHALSLLLIMMFFGQWAALIPMPVLAAILVLVAYNMSEWRTFKKLLKSPRSDVIVLLTTFVLTVIIDLTVAIQVGVVLSAVFFLKSMSDATQMNLISSSLRQQEHDAGIDQPEIRRPDLPSDMIVYEVQGALFFGAVEQFKETMSQINVKPRVFVLSLQNVLSIDASGLHAIEDLMLSMRMQGIHFVLVGPHAQPFVALDRAGILTSIGESNVFASLAEVTADPRFTKSLNSTV